ncbi:MAG: hypothetical protein ACRCS0_07010, partial [Albidovulum sp.]
MDRNAPTDEMRTAILREQYRMLANQVPVLYLIVLLATFSVCAIVFQQLTSKTLLVAPVGVGALCVWRLIYWLRARTRIETVPARIMRRDLRATSFLGPFFAISFSLAALAAVPSLPAYSQSYVLAIVWVATISSAFSLFALPVAAYGVILGSGVPMVAAFLATGQLFLVTVAIVNSCIGFLLIITLQTNYGAFSTIIDSRARIM